MSIVSKSLKRGPNDEVITVAAGCFWGTEHIYRKYFQNRIVDCRVGYANGGKENPTYQEVCTGRTNHSEALQISFDPSVVSLKELLEFFFRIHDPTTLNAQGADRGTQYRSGIYTNSTAQQTLAEQVKADMQKTWYPTSKIVTEVVPIKSFWDAEDYHQLYLNKNASGYQCPTHFLRTMPKK